MKKILIGLMLLSFSLSANESTSNNQEALINDKLVSIGIFVPVFQAYATYYRTYKQVSLIIKNIEEKKRLEEEIKKVEKLNCSFDEREENHFVMNCTNEFVVKKSTRKINRISFNEL